MKKILSVLLALAALLALATSAALAAEIALVTDVGTIDDESFNQACWEGVKAYAEANGKTYQYYQPGADSTDERLNSIDLAVSEGAKVVVCPGYLFGETVAQAQELYPDVSFIAVDVSAGDLGGVDAQQNLYCAVFGEEQAGYLAGYAVVKDGYTKLGFLGGMAVPILPWIVYFAANGALSDAYAAYIYNNIFLYSGAAKTWANRLTEWTTLFADNLLWTVPALLGMIALAFDRGETGAVRLCVWAMAIGQFAAIFFAGMVWPYSPLGMAAFAVIGLMQLHRLWGKRALSPRAKKGLTAAVCAASLVWAYFATPNAFLRGEDIGNLAQGMFAEYVEPGKTMLQYSYLDGGVYLATQTRPAGRFFAQLNVNLDEMNEEMDRYLREGIPDYVVVDWNRLPAEFDRYEEICALTSYDDSNRYIKSMILYRRKSDEE